MTEGTGIEAAIKRLQVALDTLEAASERKLESEQREAGLSEQVHVLASDRAQLAADSAVPGSVVGVRATCRKELHPLRDRCVSGLLL